MDYLLETMKHIYITVEGLANFSPTDENSNCFIMKSKNSIFFVNECPDSNWNNFELIKREIPSIIQPSELVVKMNKDNLVIKRIPELLFFEIMDYIQSSLKLLVNFIETHI